MKVNGEKSFERDVSKIRDKVLLKKLMDAIVQMENASSIFEIRNCKKIEGYDNYYRLRIGDYRLGVKIPSEQEVVLIRFLHRKEIYRYFPPK